MQLAFAGVFLPLLQKEEPKGVAEIKNPPLSGGEDPCLKNISYPQRKFNYCPGIGSLRP